MYESALLAIVCEHNEPFAVKSEEHEQSGVGGALSKLALSREGAATGWPAR